MKRFTAVVLGGLMIGAGSTAPVVSDETIDINRASYAELLAFRGIGRMYADRIVEARPFTSHKDLVARRVLPVTIYLALQHRLSVSALPSVSDEQPTGTVPAGALNLNTATRAELLTAPGIGMRFADRIIRARPYRDELELVSRRVMPLSAFEAIQGLIAVPR